MLISAWNLIRASWDLYKKNVWLLIGYAFFMLFVATIVSIIIIVPFNFILLKLIIIVLPTTFSTTVFAYIAVVLINSAIWTYVNVPFFAILIRIIAKIYNGQTIQNFKTEIKEFLPALLPTAFVIILAGVATIAGLLLFIIPGILLLVWFVFALHAVVIDGQRGINALRVSKNLVAGRWWMVVWRLVVPVILASIISGVIHKSLQSFPHTTNIDLGRTSIYAIVSFLLTLFLMSTQTILYLELKKRPLTLAEPEPSAGTPAEPPV